MASGKEHFQAATRAAWRVTIAGVAVAPLYPETILMAVGAHLARYVTPDLDMPQVTLEEGRILRYSRVLGELYIVYWMPYARHISHRHWLSHLPGVGTAIRMIYALWWLAFYVPPLWWLPLWVGWTAVDATHLMEDEWKLK